MNTSVVSAQALIHKPELLYKSSEALNLAAAASAALDINYAEVAIALFEQAVAVEELSKDPYRLSIVNGITEYGTAAKNHYLKLRNSTGVRNVNKVLGLSSFRKRELALTSNDLIALTDSIIDSTEDKSLLYYRRVFEIYKKLPNNWDLYGGLAVSEDVINYSLKLMQDNVKYQHIFKYAVPCRKSSLELEWRNNNGFLGLEVCNSTNIDSWGRIRDVDITFYMPDEEEKFSELLASMCDETIQYIE